MWISSLPMNLSAKKPKASELLVAGVIVAIAATLAASPIFFILAEAQTTSTRSVTGGSGAFSTMTCPDGTLRDRPGISFQAQQVITTGPSGDDDDNGADDDDATDNDDARDDDDDNSADDDDDEGSTNTQTQTTGEFRIVWQEDRPGATPFFKEGPITGGTISTTSFVLTGTEILDGICGAPVPIAVTISGPCGIGVTVEFVADNGERGTFRNSNVICTVT
jgi:hypothetical protein